MMKCSVYIATSVDGFIARSDGRIDWIEKPEYSTEIMAGLIYEDFIRTVDALIMGRHSFEKILTFGFWPYEDKKVIVLSSRKLDVPAEIQKKIQIECLKPGELVAKLEKEGYKHLYIDGGITIQRFLADGLINEITITRIPVLLGSGIPLFGGTNFERDLKLIEVFQSNNGFVQERYKVLN